MNSKQDGTVTSKGELTVLGGGIVGLCCAIAAQKQGFKVSLLDKDEPGRGASFGNAGHFATEQMFPLASFSLVPRLPGMLLDPQGPFRIRPGYFFKALPWFCRFMANMLPAKRRKNGAAIAALNREAIGAMRRLLAQAEASELMCENGSLLLFERDGKAALQEYEAYTKAGVAVKLLSGDEVRRLEPSLSGNIKAALFFTEVAHTPSPFELCKRLELHFKALGGRYCAPRSINCSRTSKVSASVTVWGNPGTATDCYSAAAPGPNPWCSNWAMRCRWIPNAVIT